MNLYQTLAVEIPRPEPEDAVFLCGTRCAAEVFLGRHRIGRTALSPLDVLAELDLQLDGEESCTVVRFPNHLVKTHRLGPNVTATSTWFGAWKEPCFVVSWLVDNQSEKPFLLQLQGDACYNVNYVSKFRIYPNDVASVEHGQLLVQDVDRPELVVATALSPAWVRCQVGVSGRTAADGPVSEPSSVAAYFSYQAIIAPGDQASLVLVVAGSRNRIEAQTYLQAALTDSAGLFERAHAEWEAALVEGARIKTPDPALDAFFLQSKLWGYKDTRQLPLGAPFDLAQNDNVDLPVLTASPDYHGVFANDNGQSVWEYGALGSRFYPVLANTLEVLYQYGTPESVEVDPFQASGRPWLSPLRIGQRPQWVMGACYLILWSGRYQEPYWPRIQTVLDRFPEDDRDGDFLDDDSCSTYPEQPDPGAYNHEMLYASAFWYRAFHEAAKVGRLVGERETATRYASQAVYIAGAIEERFGNSTGYASWLDGDHRQHPHRGHNPVLPVQYGLAPPERAGQILETLTGLPLMTADGPVAAEPDYPMAGGAHAWGFTRWNLVHALFRNGRPAQAMDLLHRWADQEAQLHYPAPEGFPTITGVTGKGYAWTSGRTLRALLFGLFGLELDAGGFRLQPYLPDAWEQMTILSLPFRDAVYDILVCRDGETGMRLDGRTLPDSWIPVPKVPNRHHVVTVVVAPDHQTTGKTRG